MSTGGVGAASLAVAHAQLIRPKTSSGASSGARAACRKSWPIARRAGDRRRLTVPSSRVPEMPILAKSAHRSHRCLPEVHRARSAAIRAGSSRSAGDVLWPMRGQFHAPVRTAGTGVPGCGGGLNGCPRSAACQDADSSCVAPARPSCCAVASPSADWRRWPGHKGAVACLNRLISHLGHSDQVMKPAPDKPLWLRGQLG